MATQHPDKKELLKKLEEELEAAAEEVSDLLKQAGTLSTKEIKARLEEIKDRLDDLDFFQELNA